MIPCRSEKRDGCSNATRQQSIDRYRTAFRLHLLSHTARHRLAPAYLQTCCRNSSRLSEHDFAAHAQSREIANRLTTWSAPRDPRCRLGSPARRRARGIYAARRGCKGRASARKPDILFRDPRRSAGAVAAVDLQLGAARTLLTSTESLKEATTAIGAAVARHENRRVFVALKSAFNPLSNHEASTKER
jgi:hypothetical protein